MRKGVRKRLAALAALASVSLTAMSCPLCDSETADEVRAGLLDDVFFLNLGVAALPFAVLAVLIASIHGLPSRSPRRGGG